MDSVLKTWAVEDAATGIIINREALVFQPEGVNLPILFIFHGHGGTALGFKQHQFEMLWHEAIVVYAQGLPTPTPGDPSGTSPGWQDRIGQVSEQTQVKDQDLKFFDAMMQTFAPFIDSRLVFVHGYSNGGGLVYNVLWPLRGTQLAGLAVDAATVNVLINRIPIATIHVAGEDDPVVGFDKQQDTVEAIKKLNKCSISFPFYVLLPDISSTKYWSPIHKPVVFSTYEGDHTYPDNAPKAIVRFLQRIAVLQLKYVAQ